MGCAGKLCPVSWCLGLLTHAIDTVGDTVLADEEVLLTNEVL